MHSLIVNQEHVLSCMDMRSHAVLRPALCPSDTKGEKQPYMPLTNHTPLPRVVEKAYEKTADVPRLGCSKGCSLHADLVCSNILPCWLESVYIPYVRDGGVQELAFVPHA